MKMKQTLLILLCLFTFAQTKSQSKSENDSLYIIALEKYTIEKDSFFMQFPKQPREKYETLYLEKPDFIDKLPETIRKHKLIIINSTNKDELYTKNGNSLVNLVIYPRIEKGMFKITVVPYIGSRDENRKILLELSDWTDVFFTYDCERNRWEYLKTESGGI